MEEELDPYDPNLTDEQKLAIFERVKVDIPYFFKIISDPRVGTCYRNTVLCEASSRQGVFARVLRHVNNSQSGAVVASPFRPGKARLARMVEVLEHPEESLIPKMSKVNWGALAWKKEAPTQNGFRRFKGDYRNKKDKPKWPTPRKQKG